MKKAIAILCLVMMLLSGCSSERADYKKAVEAYENQDYQSAIEIFETLGNYEDSADYLIKATQGIVEQKIDELGSSIEDDAALSELLAVCNSLTQEQFSQISNAATFEELFALHVDALGKSSKWDKALDLIQRTTILSDDCTKTCLESYGRWACIESAEDHIKEQLKSPKSYYRYKASVSTPLEREEYYIVDVYLDYGATNSFGGEVTSEEKIVVHFTIDLESRSVQFDCIGNELDVLADALEKAGF